MKRILLLLLALLGAGSFTRQVEAQTYNTAYNQGDLLVGFWATSGNGSSQSYVVDIGQATNFEGLEPGQFKTLLSSTSSTIGNIGADLTTTFGTNWIQDANLYWGVAGIATSSDPQNTIYGSIAETTAGVIFPGWTAASKSAQGIGSRDINDAGGQMSSEVSSTNSNEGVVEQDSSGNSWESYMPGGANYSDLDFGFFDTNFAASFGTSLTSAGDNPLDLYQLIPNPPGEKSNYLGTFTIDSSGDITFTDETAVPEPATYALAACGTGVLFLIARRRKARLQS